MDTLQATLGALPRARWRNVLHVGAGEAALAQHAQTHTDQLLLVEGDPQTAARLSLRCAGSTRPARLIARAVAPAAGSLRWHCYNLDRLNGPLDATPLRRLYPRLQRTGTLPVEALSFDELLAQLPVATQAGEPARDGPGGDLLVLDVPGQAEALLASVAPDALARFDWIVVRSHPDDSSADAIARRLAAGFFVAQTAPAAGDAAAWACTPWRQDRGRRREHLLGEALAESRRQAQALMQARELLELRTQRAEQRGAALEAALAAQSHRVAALESEAAVVAEQHAARVRDLLAELTERNHDHGARLRALTAERDALAAAATEHGRRAAESARRIAELEGALSELTVRLDLVRAEFDRTTEQLTLATGLLAGEGSR